MKQSEIYSDKFYHSYVKLEKDKDNDVDVYDKFLIKYFK